MYIRRTHTNNSATGERYFTHRLVVNRREGGKVRQITLLNLGRHFALEQSLWPELCIRIEDIMAHRTPLLEMNYCVLLEQEAERIAAQLLARQSVVFEIPHGLSASQTTSERLNDYQCVDLDSLTFMRPRSVGVEQLGLWAMAKLNFMPLLTHLGLTAIQRSAIVALIIGRMAAPASEYATYDWLDQHSALGELLDVNFKAMPLMTLYRAADALWQKHTVIEQALFDRVTDIFSLNTTVALYDLTNSYFEGDAASNPKAKHGRSKEKRRDCPLVSLGLVLDDSGFVRSSQTFAGNVAEGSTLKTMLEELAVPSEALIIMDAGIATAENLIWLRQQGYHYLVVSRERERSLDLTQAIEVTTASGDTVHCQKVLSEDRSEVRLYCYSEQRAAKEQAIANTFCQRFEQALQKIAEGLQRPRTEKQPEKLWRRIGRLQEKAKGMAQHYHIELQTDTDDQGQPYAIGLTWQKQAVNHSKLTHPGIYCLRSSEIDWEAEKLWRTYILLTDLEAVFRSLKSELGLRPIYHQREDRVDSHLLITVLAYQCVQVIRYQLRHQGINASWDTIRQTMNKQCRITASFRKAEGGAIHIRKATQAEPEQLEIYHALKLNPAPGGIYKTII